MMKVIRLLILLTFLCACVPLAGQGLPPPASTPPTPQPAAIRQATPTPEIQQVVAVSLRVRGSTLAAPEVEAGSAQVVEIAFDPVVQAIQRQADGSILSASTTRWENAPVAQMRYCFSSEGRPCVPPDDEQPFQASQSHEFQVDWLGPRQFYLWAEFRDRDGVVIPAVRPYSSNPQADVEVTLRVSGVVSANTALEKLPSPVLTALAATKIAYPLSGGVTIEGGRCCAGGPAGSTVHLKVDFTVRGADAAAAKEMKVQPGSSGCVKDPAQLKGSWEPFQPSRTYDTTLALNWVGWWVSVQYRDSAGNLSPVYCDDISLEGSPAKP